MAKDNISAKQTTYPGLASLTGNFCWLILVAAAFLGGIDTLADPLTSLKPTYSGLEYYSSSQLTKLEVQKMLGLKPGASVSAVEEAAARLRNKLAASGLEASIDVVRSDADHIAIAVGIASNEDPPFRRLQSPRHIEVSNPEPFTFLQQLEERKEKLTAEHRLIGESEERGVPHFQDEVCQLAADRLYQSVPSINDDLIIVVNSELEPAKRKEALHLLAFAPADERTAALIEPALDDTDLAVRVEADQYLCSRLKLFTDNFDWLQLLQNFRRQLDRPSHSDRLWALCCLQEIIKLRPELAFPAKKISQATVQKLHDETILSSIRSITGSLLDSYRSAKDPTVPSSENNEQVPFKL